MGCAAPSLRWLRRQRARALTWALKSQPRRWRLSSEYFIVIRFGCVPAFALSLLRGLSLFLILSSPVLANISCVLTFGSEKHGETEKVAEAPAVAKKFRWGSIEQMHSVSLASDSHYHYGHGSGPAWLNTNSQPTVRTLRAPCPRKSMVFFSPQAESTGSFVCNPRCQCFKARHRHAHSYNHCLCLYVLSLSLSIYLSIYLSISCPVCVCACVRACVRACVCGVHLPAAPAGER